MPDARVYLPNGLYDIYKQIPDGLRSKVIQEAFKEYIKNHKDDLEKFISGEYEKKEEIPKGKKETEKKADS